MDRYARVGKFMTAFCVPDFENQYRRKGMTGRAAHRIPQLKVDTS